MRTVFTPQMSLGQTDIADIELDLSSRDDIPQILFGLQHIFTTPSVCEAVFSILEELVPKKAGDDSEEAVRTDTGRPGMDQWKILVLGTLRLGLNTDYDRIQELANQHRTIRDMLGHGVLDEDQTYSLQTLKDNLTLFSPEILDRINQEVVRAGHSLVGRNPDEGINGRCDSFVVETDVHFPTDINLLYDAVRVMIRLCTALCELWGLPGWRNNKCNIREFKKLYRKVQKLKHSTSKNAAKRQAKEAAIREAYQAYLKLGEHFLNRARASRDQLNQACGLPLTMLEELQTFMDDAKRQIDQIRRRVLEDEKIPHEEKVFSLFERHTEWISKGKAGVPVELGLRVCILEDVVGFILHHKVMEKETDDKVAVEMVTEAQQRFPILRGCSYDKGFHSPQNQEALKETLDLVVLPKKGRLSKADKEREYSEEFMNMRHQHSAVESAINALEVHGLDKCLDHGIEGFKRYVALAVLARNIQKLGAIKRNLERERERASKQKAA
jgi:HPt (histidine-containing phosphotransfer) domain-containing protein